MSAASLPTQIRVLMATPEPPELGPGPRPAVFALKGLQQRLAAMLSGVKLEPQRKELIEAVVLLWHDHHEPAHAMVQNLEDPDGSYVHAILHRREPDYGNARYWCHRVGRHVSFRELALVAANLFSSSTHAELKATLLPEGEWNSLAFVGECERAESKPDSDPVKRILREIQAAEFEILLKRFCA